MFFRSKKTCVIKNSLIFSVLLICILFFFTLTIYGESIDLVAATINPEGGYLARSLIEFAEKIDERSNGQLKTKVFTAGQVGDASSIYESVIQGNLDIIVTDIGWFVEQNPVFEILETCYLFKNREHFKSIFNTPGKLEYFENLILKNPGLKLIYYVGGSERDIISTFPIRTVDDLDGKIMRSKSTSTEMEWWKLLGANPIPIAYNELFTALETGVVLGSQNSPDGMITMRFVEVCKYLARTQHYLQTTAIVMNKSKFDSLPEELQKIILEVGKEVQLKYIDIGFDEVDENIKTIKEEYGLEITYPDKEPFIEISRKQMWDLAEKYKITDLVKEIFE